jgi:hypothetical protein
MADTVPVAADAVPVAADAVPVAADAPAVAVALVPAELLELADEPHAAVTAAARRMTGAALPLLTPATPLAPLPPLPPLMSRRAGNLCSTMKTPRSTVYYSLLPNPDSP